MQNAINELTTISGQKLLLQKARKAISNFKIRVGDPVGARVTLRKWHMYEFLERLISIRFLPRVRDLMVYHLNHLMEEVTIILV